MTIFYFTVILLNFIHYQYVCNDSDSRIIYYILIRVLINVLGNRQ